MAGHIPAGMELFAAGDKSQLETIKRWIIESDVFMLILGGRYGTIDSASGKSYIELEYEYAIEQNKPAFAAVISDHYLDQKVRNMGKEVLEVEHTESYRNFKKTVMSRICRFFDDVKDLKLIVHESIPQITHDKKLSGWVRGDEVIDPKKTLEEMSQLQTENVRLIKQVHELEKKISSDLYNGYSFEELLSILQDERVDVGELPELTAAKDVALINLFLAFADRLAVGVENWIDMNKFDRFIFFKIAPKLVTYGLTQKRSANNQGVQRFQTSEIGNRFLAKAKPMFRDTLPKPKEILKSTKQATQRKSAKKHLKSRVKN